MNAEWGEGETGNAKRQSPMQELPDKVAGLDSVALLDEAMHQFFGFLSCVHALLMLEDNRVPRIAAETPLVVLDRDNGHELADFDFFYSGFSPPISYHVIEGPHSCSPFIGFSRWR